MKKRKIYQKELRDWEQSAKFHKLTSSHPFRRFTWQQVFKTYKISKAEGLILEIGCGAGSFTSLLTSQNKKVTGVDFVQNMLKIAKKTNPSASLVLASAEKLPFKDSSFNAVIANMVLHHLKAQGILTQSLKEIHRVLKPGGTFYVFDHQDTFLSRLFLNLFNFGQRVILTLKRDLSTSGTTSEVIFSKKDLQKLLKQGFNLEKTTMIITFPYRLLEVTSNAIGYLLGLKIGLKAANLFFPLARWFEENLNFCWIKTEQCLKFKKI